MNPPNLAKDIVTQNLLDFMNEGVWVGDANEKTVYANAKFCKMVGYELAEILGWESYKFWDRDSSRKVRQVNQNERKQSRASSYEGTLVSRAGLRIPVLLSGAPLPNGGTIGIMTDLTELKDKEKARQILEDAIDHSKEAILIVNSAGKIIFWNRGAQLIWGYKEETILNKSIEGLFESNDVKDLILKTRSFSDFEILARHKNRKPFNIQVTVTPAGDDRLVIARDMSVHKVYEDELSSKYEKLQEAYNGFGVIRRQMDYVFDLLKQASEYTDPHFLYDFIVSSSLMLTRADACVFRVYDPMENHLEMVSSLGVPREWVGKRFTKMVGSLVEEAFKNKMVFKIVDVGHESKYQSVYLAKKAGFSALLLIPLHFRGKFLGSLSLYLKSDQKLHLFDNDFIERYSHLVSMILAMPKA